MPLNTTLLVDWVNVPVPVKLPPMLMFELPVQTRAFSVLSPGMEIFPVAVNVPVVIFTLLSRVIVLVSKKFRFAHERVPAPMLIVCATKPVGFEKVMFPVTNRPKLPKIVTVLAIEFAAKVSELHSAPAALTVTVIAELIVTASAAVGTGCPPQVTVLFQLPDTLAVR